MKRAVGPLPQSLVGNKATNASRTYSCTGKLFKEILETLSLEYVDARMGNVGMYNFSQLPEHHTFSGVFVYFLPPTSSSYLHPL